MRAGQQTHNRHLDAARAIVAGTPHPTPLTPHDLECALRLARNAYRQLREAMQLLDADNALRVHAETAFQAARRLGMAADARMPKGRAH